MNFKDITITKARKLLDSKELSVKELVDYYLKNIEERNKKLNAYLEVYEDIAEQVEKAQGMIDNGIAEELTGIPIAIKDNILIKGKKASSASKMLEDYTAVYTATAMEKITKQGAVLLGRVNMDEFAMGGSTENSAFGVVRNPHDETRVAGGSSGGSASAVAGEMAMASLGSDTGGSVREPASFCGIVGFKPTYGAISRYGLMAMGSSLDIIGPLTKSVSDAETLFNVMKGKDKMDSTSIEIPANSYKLEAKKIGVPTKLISMEGIDPVIRENFNDSVNKLKELGFEIVDVDLPNIDKALAIYYIVMPAEVSSNMSRYDGMRYGLQENGKDLLETYKKSRGKGFGPEVRRRIILGTYILSAGYYDAYYGKAMKARKILKKEFEEAFKNVDAIMTPTSPILPWKIGEKSSPLEVYLADIFTVTANIVGCPSLSVPSGSTVVEGKKLPLGIQFMSKEKDDYTVLHIGKKFLGEE